MALVIITCLNVLYQANVLPKEIQVHKQVKQPYNRLIIIQPKTCAVDDVLTVRKYSFNIRTKSPVSPLVTVKVKRQLFVLEQESLQFLSSMRQERKREAGEAVTVAVTELIT